MDACRRDEDDVAQIDKWGPPVAAGVESVFQFRCGQLVQLTSDDDDLKPSHTPVESENVSSIFTVPLDSSLRSVRVDPELIADAVSVW